MFRPAVCAFLLLLLAVPTVSANGHAEPLSPGSEPSRSGATPLVTAIDWSPAPWAAPAQGALLPALYVGLSGLNAFDAYGTPEALSRGAVEANPLMHGIAAKRPVMWAIKGGVTVASILVAERLWRQNRRPAAVALMVISNGLMAVVAAQNASVLRRMER